MNRLEVRELSVHFPTGKKSLFGGQTGTVKAVDGVSLSLAAGEVLGLVGESGCGKSTLARGILRLVPVASGSVLLEGEDLCTASPSALHTARRKIQMVFQDPHASLNPRMSVYDALAEPLLAHGLCGKAEVPRRVADLMARVGLAARFVRKYPHEFSGGQRQRIAIARALAVEPRVLVADEPVSALDVSIQAQVLNLLSGLVRELNLSLLFISHDLSVVKHISDRVAVMYLGSIVEEGPAESVIDAPRHPYTRALVSAAPIADPVRARELHRVILQGEPPSPINPPSGCTFHPRCPHALDTCRQHRPALETCGPAHRIACPVQAKETP
jgi:oligopeptide transport system ATP-binding protein